MVKQLAANAIEAMKGQPLVLALLLLNLLYMAGGFVIWREERAATRTTISQLLDRCQGP